MKAAVFVALLTMTGCVPAPYPAVSPVQLNQDRSSVERNLTVPLASKDVSRFMSELEADPAFSDTHVMLRANPWFQPRLRSTMKDRTYAEALDDARAKASVLAARMRAQLGPVQAIQEMTQNGGAQYVGASPVVMKGISMQSVRGDASGVVMLAVTFASSLGPISVFGSQVGAPPQFSADSADGISIEITARAARLSDAADHLRKLDAAARAIANRFGVASAAIRVQETQLNSY